MRKIVLAAAIAALAACSQQAEDDEASTETAEAEATTAAATGTQPGTYEVTMADGTKGTTVINADGTYVDTDKDGKQEKGTFVRKDDKDCFDPEGDEPEECWTVTPPGADGTFTAKSADGKTTVTVRPSTASATGTTATASPAPAAT